jgi:hypothetical protein
MQSWLWPLIMLFVAIDLFVVFLVIARVRARTTVEVSGKPVSFDLFSVLAVIRTSAKEIDDSVTEFMRGNFSGQKEQLPQALGGAVERARSLIASHDMKIDEEMLRSFVVHIVATHKFAPRADIVTAMNAVPRPEASATS